MHYNYHLDCESYGEYDDVEVEAGGVQGHWQCEDDHGWMHTDRVLVHTALGTTAATLASLVSLVDPLGQLLKAHCRYNLLHDCSHDYDSVCAWSLYVRMQWILECERQRRVRSGCGSRVIGQWF